MDDKHNTVELVYSYTGFSNYLFLLVNFCCKRKEMVRTVFLKLGREEQFMQGRMKNTFLKVHFEIYSNLNCSTNGAHFT